MMWEYHGNVTWTMGNNGWNTMNNGDTDIMVIQWYSHQFINRDIHLLRLDCHGMRYMTISHVIPRFCMANVGMGYSKTWKTPFLGRWTSINPSYVLMWTAGVSGLFGTFLSPNILLDMISILWSFFFARSQYLLLRYGQITKYFW